MTKEELQQRILEVTGPAQTDYIWSLWVEFVAAWMEEHNGWGDEGAMENARSWRQEMA